MCEHHVFESDVLVVRVIEPGADPRFMAHVQIRCTGCRTRFAFQGLPIGVSLTSPMVSPPGFELRAPIEPDAHLTSLLGADPRTAFPARER